MDKENHATLFSWSTWNDDLAQHALVTKKKSQHARKKNYTRDLEVMLNHRQNCMLITGKLSQQN